MRSMKVSTAIEKSKVEVIKDYDNRDDSFRVILPTGDTYDVEAKSKSDAKDKVLAMLSEQPLLPDGLIADK